MDQLRPKEPQETKIYIVGIQIALGVEPGSGWKFSCILKRARKGVGVLFDSEFEVWERGEVCLGFPQPLISCAKMLKVFMLRQVPLQLRLRPQLAA